MRVFITGSTGLIGRRLVHDRLERGDELVVLTRDAQKLARLFAPDRMRNVTALQGDPAVAGAWQESISGCDAVIHLAGAGIADRRWTAAYKRILRSSRLASTEQIVHAINRASARPNVLINGSAVGYYGDRGDEELTESSPPGTDFLAQLCQQWEAQAAAAEQFGLRVVMLRTGPVLDGRGGALQKMILPFKFFAGGPLGSGRQFIPWIHWRDVIGMINHALAVERLRGPLNVVAPAPIRQRDFARALGRALGRPSFMPTPKFALRLALGEVAHALVASQRVVPQKALQSNYGHVFSQIEKALEDLLAERDAKPLSS